MAYFPAVHLWDVDCTQQRASILKIIWLSSFRTERQPMPPLGGWCRPQQWHCLVAPWIGCTCRSGSSVAKQSLLLSDQRCWWFPQVTKLCTGRDWKHSSPNLKRLTFCYHFPVVGKEGFPLAKLGWRSTKLKNSLFGRIKDICLFQVSKMLCWRGLKWNWVNEVALKVASMRPRPLRESFSFFL